MGAVGNEHARPVDFSKPNAARIYHALLDGKDTSAADRDAVELLEAACPPRAAGRMPLPREMAARNRVFLDRAVTWAAEQGVAQFLDLGAGFPAGGRVLPVPDGDDPVALRDTHRAAQEVNPAARCVYVDDDPMVVSHLAALAAGGKGVVTAGGDLAGPDAILAAAAGTLDFGQPVAVIFGMVLHLFRVERAREITAAYAAAMAPGSLLVISSPRCDLPDLWGRLRAAYAAAETWNHDPAQFASFFGGTEIIPPGVTAARGWRRRGEWAVGAQPDGPCYVLAGIGVKGQP
jgi:O-methyltransferase involved in polyketide biosynthesis